MSMQDTLTLGQRAPAISQDEAIALVVALAAHALLVAALTLGAPGREVQPPPERMTVTFAEQVADVSTSPDPFEQAAPDEAPVIGEVPPEPAPQVAPAPVPQIQPRVVQPAPSRAAPRVAQPQPRQPPPKAAPKPPADTRDRRRPDAPVGGSRIGNDFLKGVPTGTRPGAKGNPAAVISDQAKASVRVSINREVLPPWNSCPVNGVDVEKLRARVTFHMDRSGRVLSIDPFDASGANSANAPQVARFKECAVRAIQAASPFNLPPESYDFWKNYTLNFRKE